jgi:hypothetical protein
MSEPLGDRRKRFDNLLQNMVEEHNQPADELLGVFQRDFPRTYRLLDGPHFQLPTDERPTTSIIAMLSMTTPERLSPRPPNWPDAAVWTWTLGAGCVVNVGCSTNG